MTGKKLLIPILGSTCVLASSIAWQDSPGVIFSVTYPEALANGPLDGRLLLIISSNDKEEPRFQINDSLNTEQIFGIDVEGWAAKQPAVIDSSVLGYPLESTRGILPGEYNVQALLHIYETFRRSDGKVVKLPMDRGEGQQWNRAPGNLFSTPRKLRVDAAGGSISIVLDQKIPPIDPPRETRYVKPVRIQSELLTRFWGRPMHLGAHVLLPEGFEQHPEARYPLAIFHGHFPHELSGWREVPPDPDLIPERSERFGLEGYNKIVQEQAYQLYKDWTAPGFPRVLAVEIQHANPFYDDSYAVNSVNVGPYGDAINQELIPYIEQQFRGIGQGWARFMYGGSTGGWEALASQILYPNNYNGCWAACPDPIDFRAYTVVNIYEDENAYYAGGKWKRTARPGFRNYLGHLTATLEQMNQRELVLGTRSRSGDQWDIWEAVFSPVGPDGYPKRIWEKRTGKIDRSVAEYWREHYDLRYILERDWKTLGPKLRGKINIYCGDMDNFYLNNAVYLMEDFLKNTKDPHYEGEVDYGNRAEHCWNGDHSRPNALSRLRYHQMFIPRGVKRILETAPPGADVKSWVY
ncbi:MAG: hypothetical protein EHM61_23630 [Acidobacteria bacterium]|nr:MAG: hypothetical protein EHM61_23630 [Acidobacteriota bacterium]